MNTENAQSVNLLDVKPTRNLQWETRESELVTLLVPKFRNHYLVKWFLPLFSKPNFRVNLDAYGSFVWHHCDGNTTVFEIGERMKEKFGEAVDPLYERIAQFIQKLEQEKFLALKFGNES
jgi:hypothetical protein